MSFGSSSLGGSGVGVGFSFGGGGASPRVGGPPEGFGVGVACGVAVAGLVVGFGAGVCVGTAELTWAVRGRF